MTENEFIYFTEETTPVGRKTRVISVVNRKGDYALGYIRWFGPWRQYCFFPAGSQMVFNKTCMNTIIEKMDELMAERRG